MAKAKKIIQPLVAKEMPFKDHVPDSVIFPQRDQFENENYNSSGGIGVWYDEKYINDYMSFNFHDRINYIQKRAQLPPPANSKWVVGFYWILKEDPNDGNKQKVSFCVIPTIVDVDKNNKVYDYFNPKYRKYYFTQGYRPRVPKKQTNDDIAYDDGTLFP